MKSNCKRKALCWSCDCCRSIVSSSCRERVSQICAWPKCGSLLYMLIKTNLLIITTYITMSLFNIITVRVVALSSATTLTVHTRHTRHKAQVHKAQGSGTQGTRLRYTRHKAQAHKAQGSGTQGTRLRHTRHKAQAHKAQGSGTQVKAAN